MADDGRLAFGSSLDNEALIRGGEEAKGVFRDISQSASAEGTRIDNTFKNLGRAIGGYFSIKAAADFGRQIIKVSGEIEKLEVSFRTLLGDEQKAVSLMADIRKFAGSTPMQMNDLAQGAQTLLSFNIEAEKVMPTLQAIGDISMGDSAKFNALTLAFAQMSSTGKLMGQDLMQMINAGFNPLAQIAEKTGKSISTLKDEMSAGKISVEMVTEAFMDATAEGGKFHGMLEQQSQGIQGSISNLQGAISDMMNDLGESIQEPVTEGIQLIQRLVQNYETLGKIIATLVASYGGYKAAVIAYNAAVAISTQVTKGYTIAQQLEYTWLLLVEKAQKLLNRTMLANPFVLAATAIISLISALVLLRKRTSEAEQAQAALNRAEQESSDRQQALKDETQQLLATLDDEKATDMAHFNALDRLKQLYPTLLKDVKDYNDYLTQRKSILESMPNEQEGIETGEMEASIKRMKADLDVLNRGITQTHISHDAWVVGEKYQEQFDLSRYNLPVKVQKALEESIAAAEQVLKERKNAIAKAEWMSKPIEQRIEITETSLKQSQAAVRVLKERLEKSPWNMKLRLDASLAEQTVAKLQADLAALQAQVASTPKRTIADIRKEIRNAQDELNKARAAYRKDASEANKKRVSDAEGTLDTAKKDYKTATGKDYDQAVKSAQDAQKKQNELNAAYQQEQKKYADWLVKSAKQAVFDRQQAEINAMQEGLPKTLAQIRLDYDRQMSEIAERENEMVERLRDLKEKEWEAANPDRVKKGEKFDRSAVTAADLSTAQQQQVKDYGNNAAEQRRRAEEAAYKASLADILDYQQQRTKIEEEYQRRREALYQHNEDGSRKKDSNGGDLFVSGAGEGNLSELNKQQTDALAAIDEQFASREDTYVAWCNEISSYTLEQLEYVLLQAQQALEAAEQNGASGEKLATARAKVNTATKAVSKKKAEQAVSPKKAIKEWDELYSAIQDADSALGDVIDSIGDLSGSNTKAILTATKTVLTSAMAGINGIVQLVQMSSASMTATATGAATAIGMVEKASVILTVISAALSIAMALFNVFKSQKAKEHEKEMQKYEDQLEEINDRYDELDKAADKAFGSSKKKMIESQKELKKTQIEILKAELAAEKAQSKKDRDDDKIKQLEKDIKTAEEEYNDLGEAAKDAIFGKDIKSAIEELSDAIVDAWSAGANASMSATDVAKKMMREMIEEQIKDAIMAQDELHDMYSFFGNWFSDFQDKADKTFGIEYIREKMREYLENDGIFDDNEKSEITRLYEQLMQNIDEQFGWAQDIFDDSSREGSKKGIANISQESADRIDGGITAMQGMLSVIKQQSATTSENTTILRDTVSAIQSSVQRIEYNTEELHTIRTTINDIQLQGVKIRS